MFLGKDTPVSKSKLFFSGNKLKILLIVLNMIILLESVKALKEPINKLDKKSLCN